MKVVLNYVNDNVTIPIKEGDLETIDNITSRFFDSTDFLLNSEFTSQINFYRHDMNLSNEKENIKITYNPADVDVKSLDSYIQLCGDIEGDKELKIFYSDEADKTDIMMLKKKTMLRFQEFPNIDIDFYKPLTSGENGYFFARILDETLDHIEVESKKQVV